jgi:hypothetical protein
MKKDGDFVEGQLAGCAKHERLAIDARQSKERRAHVCELVTILVRLGNRRLRAGSASKGFERGEESSPCDGPSRPSLRDGKHECIRRIGWTGSAPPSHERSEGVLGDVLCGASATDPRRCVRDQPRSEHCSRFLEIHGSKEPSNQLS